MNPQENATNSFIASCPHLPNIDVSFVSGRLENDDETLDGGRTNRQKRRQSFRIRSFLKAGEGARWGGGGGGTRGGGDDDRAGGGGAMTEQRDDDRTKGR